MVRFSGEEARFPSGLMLGRYEKPCELFSANVPRNKIANPNLFFCILSLFSLSLEPASLLLVNFVGWEVRCFSKMWAVDGMLVG